MTVIKLCGLQSLEDAQVAVSNGATHIGIICVQNRKRTISPQEAIKISKWVHDQTQNNNTNVKLVGVFQNQPIEQVQEFATQYGLDIVQLHGEEDWESYYEIIQKPIIKRCVFPKDCSKVIDINSSNLDCLPLFDSAMGGTGELLNWNQIDKWAIENNNKNIQFILAGGLTPSNVNDALHIHGVIGVDVSGGVETDGVKDHDKIKTFISNAKSSL